MHSTKTTNDMAYQAIENSFLAGSAIIGWFYEFRDGRDEQECNQYMYANTMGMVSHLSVAMCAIDYGDYSDEYNEIQVMHGIMAVLPECTSESMLKIIGDFVERLGEMLEEYENPYTSDGDGECTCCATCAVIDMEDGSIIPDELHDHIDWSEVNWHWVEVAA